MQNITIGQYYPINSHIHRLDARVKLTLTTIYIAALFISTSFLGYIFIINCLCIVIRLSKVPLKYILKGLKGIIAIIIFTSLINMFFTPGEHVLFETASLKLTEEGLIHAIKISLRLVLLIMGSSILTLTTSPLELTDALEFLLKPFKKIGVPSHEIAMMLTIALRFIPTLFEEANKIMEAQMARGANFDTGGLIEKAKSLIPILVPLFISSIRRAEELAVAMEARCYRGDIGRTKMKQLKLKTADFAAMFIACLFFIVCLIIKL